MSRPGEEADLGLKMPRIIRTDRKRNDAGRSRDAETGIGPHIVLKGVTLVEVHLSDHHLHLNGIQAIVIETISQETTPGEQVDRRVTIPGHDPGHPKPAPNLQDDAAMSSTGTGRITGAPRRESHRSVHLNDRRLQENAA
ncbi:hypothetical protein OQA88_11273 [Cercophora sp. LCS_1]